MSLSADELIACYRAGVFPMGEARDDPEIYLCDPQHRGVIPLEGFHLSRRLARTVRIDAFQVTVDTAFEATVEACAKPAPGREDSWINAPIRALYTELHRRGFAHSVECRRAGELVGGLYGVAIGGAFFGESMWSSATDASKVALVHLVARLRAGGFVLLDAQFMADHLRQFGTAEIARADYRRRLARALDAPGDFYALPADATGAAALQAITHRS